MLQKLGREREKKRPYFFCFNMKKESVEVEKSFSNNTSKLTPIRFIFVFARTSPIHKRCSVKGY